MYSTIIGSALTLTAYSWILALTIPKQPNHNMTVGQIVSATLQIVILCWTAMMLLTNSFTNTPVEIFAGYLIYDSIDLVVKPIGKNVTEFHVHHCLVIFLMLIIYYFVDYNIFNCYSMLLVLETSALMLNITNLTKQYIPSFKQINTINVFVYFVSRVVLFPVCIYYWINNVLVHGTLHFASGLSTLLLVLGYIGFCWWFMKLYKKTYRV
jgi:hypothetical protein